LEPVGPVSGDVVEQMGTPWRDGARRLWQGSGRNHHRPQQQVLLADLMRRIRAYADEQIG
jgi:hypothetical protein